MLLSYIVQSFALYIAKDRISLAYNQALLGYDKAKSLILINIAATLHKERKLRKRKKVFLSFGYKVEALT